MLRTQKIKGNSYMKKIVFWSVLLIIMMLIGNGIYTMKRSLSNIQQQTSTIAGQRVPEQELVIPHPVWVQCADNELLVIPKWKIDQIKVLQLLFAHQRGTNSSSNPIEASMCNSQELQLIVNALDAASRGFFSDFFFTLYPQGMHTQLINTAGKLEANGLFLLCASETFPKDIQQILTQTITPPIMQAMASKHAIQELKLKQDQRITPIALSHNGKVLLCYYNYDLYLINVDSRQIITRLGENTKEVKGAFSSDDKKIALNDDNLKIITLDEHYNVISEKQLASDFDTEAILLHPTKNIIVSLAGEALLYDDSDNEQPRHNFGALSTDVGALSPDGTKLYCIMKDENENDVLVVFDTTTYEKIRELPIEKIIYNPEGIYTHTGTSYHDPIKNTYSPEAAIEHYFGVTSIAISPDGKKIMIGSGQEHGVGQNNYILFLLHEDTGEIIHRFTGAHYCQAIYSIAFNADGSKVATGGTGVCFRYIKEIGNGKIVIEKGDDKYGNSVCIWNTTTGSQLYKNSLFEKRITTFLSFISRQNKIIADNAIYDLSIMETIETVPFLKLSQIKLLYQFYLASLNDITPTLHENSIEFKAYMSLPETIKKLTVIPNIQKASSSEILNTLIQIMSTIQPSQCIGHGGPVSSVAYSPKDNTIVSGGVGYTDNLIVWNADTQQILKKLNASQISINVITFSPDGIHVLVGGNESAHKLTLWNIITGEKKELLGHAGEVTTAAFNSDGTKIVSGGRGSENNLFVWNAITGQQLYNLSGHNDGVATVAFNNDGTKIASGGWGEQNNLFVWNLETQEHTNLNSHKEGVFSVTFSPHSHNLVSGGGGTQNNLVLWDLHNQSYTVLNGHNDSVNVVAFSPNGALFVSGGDGNKNNLFVWNNAGRLEHNLKGHLSSVKSVAFNHDGTHPQIVSGGLGKNNLFIWDAYIGNPIYSMHGNNNSINTVLFSFDDAKIISCGGISGENSLTIWTYKIDIAKELKQLEKDQLELLYNFYIKHKNNMLIDLSTNEHEQQLYNTLPNIVKKTASEYFNIQGIELPEKYEHVIKKQKLQ
jgi:WD40 repeat protein